MTPETVMASYRNRTGDTDKNKLVISDQEGVDYINDGIRSFLTSHPECGLQADGTVIAYAAANKNAMGTALILSNTYFEPLVNYVCMRRYTKDAGDARDEQRAAFHLGLINAFWTGA